jgi:hypothetical protein
VNEDRARQGVEHLQAAAVEVIAAMRAFLDVAEDLVRDPAQAAVLAASLAEAARTATAPPTGPAEDSTEAPAAAARVTRIRVS